MGEIQLKSPVLNKAPLISSIGRYSAFQVPIYPQNDFEIDEDGVSYLLSSVYIGNDDEPQEIRVLLDEVIDALCEDFGDVDGYQHLYVVAHELSRSAEILREKAGFIEDSVSAVNDLFNLADEQALGISAIVSVNCEWVLPVSINILIISHLTKM